MDDRAELFRRLWDNLHEIQRVHGKGPGMVFTPWYDELLRLYRERRGILRTIEARGYVPAEGELQRGSSLAREFEYVEREIREYEHRREYGREGRRRQGY